MKKSIQKTIKLILASCGLKVTRTNHNKSIHRIDFNDYNKKNKKPINTKKNHLIHLNNISKLDLINKINNSFEERSVTGFVFELNSSGNNLRISVLESQMMIVAQAIEHICETTFNHDFLKTGRLVITACSGDENLRIHFNTMHENNEYYGFKHKTLLPRRLYKNSLNDKIQLKKGLLKYNDIVNHPINTVINFPIDLVFTWVNADDDKWKLLYSQHSGKIIKDSNSRSRFHNRDELKYALRSWDQYTNFINNIYIVSNCAPPDWLNLNHEKIKWVDHSEIFPSSALPTFSSHAIEARLHKIEGLSNHFIYSNDDFFLTRPANVNDFFYSNGIAKVRLETWGSVYGKAIEGHADYLNAARNGNQLLEKEFQISSTQIVCHSPQSFRKDILNEIEAKWKTEIEKTYNNKFRNIDDISLTGYFHAHYAIITGRAVPDNTPVKLIQPNHDYKKILSELVQKKKLDINSLPLTICLNDGQNSHENKEWNMTLIHFLKTFFPRKSRFEK